MLGMVFVVGTCEVFGRSRLPAGTFVRVKPLHVP